MAPPGEMPYYAYHPELLALAADLAPLMLAFDWTQWEAEAQLLARTPALWPAPTSYPAPAHHLSPPPGTVRRGTPGPHDPEWTPATNPDSLDRAAGSAGTGLARRHLPHAV